MGSDQAGFLAILGQMAARGSRVDLSGAGGDELFTLAPAGLHDLARSSPLAALAVLRRRRLFRRFPVLPVLRAALDRSSFASQLARMAGTLTAPAGAKPFGLGWEPELRRPPWATARAVAAAARMLRECASRAPEPLSPQRATHTALQCLRAGGNAYRQADQFTTEALGIGYAVPFYDDAVIEAVLPVRLRDRVEPAGYKPLLKAAMRGIVPGTVLARTSKGEYSADSFAGIRRHRDELLELFGDSQQSRAGLIVPSTRSDG